MLMNPAMQAQLRRMHIAAAQAAQAQAGGRAAGGFNVNPPWPQQIPMSMNGMAFQAPNGQPTHAMIAQAATAQAKAAQAQAQSQGAGVR